MHPCWIKVLISRKRIFFLLETTAQSQPRPPPAYTLCCCQTPKRSPDRPIWTQGSTGGRADTPELASSAEDQDSWWFLNQITAALHWRNPPDVKKPQHAFTRSLTLSTDVNDCTKCQNNDSQQNQKNYKIIMQICATLTVKASLMVGVQN